jgi:flagellar biosynthetic protein FlhB
MADSKTQKPTPHRRKKAREQGQIARSRELAGVLALIGAAVTISALCTDMARQWTTFYRGLLVSASEDDFSPGGPVLFWTAVEVLRWIGPVLLVALLLSGGVMLAQGGLNFAPAALTPKFERFSPANRLRQIFSVTTFGSLIKSLLPFLVIALIGIASFEAHWTQITQACGEDLRTTAAVMSEVLRAIGWKAVLVLLAWAAVDYLLVWRQNETRLRMSHEEVKRESKEQEGNPFTKIRVRKRQRSMRKRKPLEAAAKATLVVTNPTHYAVALLYERSMAAPEVIAKGQDLLAQKIKSIAQENSVPLIENKVLARALYKDVEVGHVIPAELYQAVAEILVAVFRAQEELREQENMRSRRNAAGEVIGKR